jgi:hypothetical protein
VASERRGTCGIRKTRNMWHQVDEEHVVSERRGTCGIRKTRNMWYQKDEERVVSERRGTCIRKTRNMYQKDEELLHYHRSIVDRWIGRRAVVPKVDGTAPWGAVGLPKWALIGTRGGRERCYYHRGGAGRQVVHLFL